ncbi:MAG: rod shape-determining protein RodA [Lentisphaerae bacterium]|nr:rod shape-determining protein RodA [Lentisphaerota bacterium]
MFLHSARKNLRLYARLDWLALLLQTVLLALGVFFIYGIGQKAGGAMAVKWSRQIMWIAVGGLVYIAATLVDYRTLGKFSWVFYLMGLITLAIVIPLGTVLNASRSWLNIPGLGMLQPSEPCKATTLLFAAWCLSHPVLKHSKIPLPILAAVILAPPLLLIMVQPDYGTALVYLPFCLALLFVNGLSWRWIGCTLAAAIILMPIGYTSLKPHQQGRINVFLKTPANFLFLAVSPLLSENQRDAWQNRQEEFFRDTETLGGGDWNAKQSLLAVGSGGFYGKGYMQGTQHILGYLPRTVAPTDFIFSVIAEEFGFIGAAGVIALLAMIIILACRTAILAGNDFGASVAVGGAAILATHTFINVGMNFQAAPIIGIPLPFVSYGGSFMVTIMAIAGLIQNIHMRRGTEERQHHHVQLTP